MGGERGTVLIHGSNKACGNNDGRGAARQAVVHSAGQQTSIVQSFRLTLK